MGDASGNRIFDRLDCSHCSSSHLSISHALAGLVLALTALGGREDHGPADAEGAGGDGSGSWMSCRLK